MEEERGVGLWKEGEVLERRNEGIYVHDTT
jgi:hypothetical protein